jgi:hypothetical protein
MNQGITFTVYSDVRNKRKNFSFESLEFLQNEWKVETELHND